MKFVKLLVASASSAVVLSAPILFASAASAAVQVPVQCPTEVSDGEFDTSENHLDICDIAVDKEVSVNGGAYIEADTSGTAATAHIGDTITWKITVTNNSLDDLEPHGAVYVKDVLPTGVTYGSYTATDGTYHADDGSLFANDWALPLLRSDDDGDFESSLPATLTITTTANAPGLSQNTAVLSLYDSGSCDGGCVYGDSNPSNDSNDAWISVLVPPQVLGASTTLVNTGSGLLESVIAGIVILITLIVTASGRLFRRRSHYVIEAVR